MTGLPLHLLESVRSHGKPREQLQMLQKPSSPEPDCCHTLQNCWWPELGVQTRKRSFPFTVLQGQNLG